MRGHFIDTLPAFWSTLLTSVDILEVNGLTYRLRGSGSSRCGLSATRLHPPSFLYARSFSESPSRASLSFLCTPKFLAEATQITQASLADASRARRLKKPVVPHCTHYTRPLAARWVSVCTTSLLGKPLTIHGLNQASSVRSLIFFFS